MKGEFDFIARHFRPLAGPESLDLRDDCGIIPASALRHGTELAISTDTMVENVHFLSSDPPKTLGKKLLRCNLSDLAAMGASPHLYTLNITVPRQNDKYNDSWFADFCLGLAEDQRQFNISLLGGDTTSIKGPLVISATVFGRLEQGQKALRRNNLRIGDSLWVTGTIGDAALGLLALQGRFNDPTGFLSQRYRIPEPRIGLNLSKIANAAMDISDGLIQDCQHLAKESRVGIKIYAFDVPISPAAQNLGSEWLVSRLTGGDDYELLLSCSPERDTELQEECLSKGIEVTKIGFVTSGKDVHLIDAEGNKMLLPQQLGWQHF